jgi:ATP-dependent HslUV protease, peptidase subunit HslV
VTSHSTTIVAVRRDGVTALAGDGQITVGDIVFKHNTVKLRKAREGKVVVGYAGAAADSLALFERLEAKLDEYSGNVPRAAVELVKQWRMDRVLRRLEAMLIVADRENLLLVSGTGDVIVPDGDVIAIGSGGGFAQAAAEAMLQHTTMDAEAIATESIRIASQICVYTNDHITVEVLR